jgi:hypothetical protein
MLLIKGWIWNAREIPPDAIPVDPEKISSAEGSYNPPKYYKDVNFKCMDCGSLETWKAEDQQWYYESTGAPHYKTANRCRDCRNKEKDKKHKARKSAGHE